MTVSPRKARSNITVDRDVLNAARDLGISISAVSDAALRAAVREARAKAWHAENADALEARRDWIDQNGTPLAALQVLKPD